MTQTSDGRSSGGAGYEPSRDSLPERAASGLAGASLPDVRAEGERAPPAPDAPSWAGEGGGLIDREAAAILASLEALRRCAHFGRHRPEVAGRLSSALSRVDEALAEAVRELYGRAGDSEES